MKGAHGRAALVVGRVAEHVQRIAPLLHDPDLFFEELAHSDDVLGSLPQMLARPVGDSPLRDPRCHILCAVDG
ncbi:MAG TPA: hypothetical protein VFC51_01295 [Chloroflexota bacterium]|nr:hypothetical protein [Chloroflexota bacterium]